MLSEEVNERILHNMPLVSTEGACKFCGQLAAIQVPGDWTDEEKNEYATEMCMSGSRLVSTEQVQERKRTEESQIII